MDNIRQAVHKYATGLSPKKEPYKMSGEKVNQLPDKQASGGFLCALKDGDDRSPTNAAVCEKVVDQISSCLLMPGEESPVVREGCDENGALKLTS